MDFFDLFEMIITGGNRRFERNGGRFVYRQNHHEEEEADGEQQRQRQRPGLGQFLPLIMLTLMYVVPYIFSSVINYLLLHIF